MSETPESLLWESAHAAAPPGGVGGLSFNKNPFAIAACFLSRLGDRVYCVKCRCVLLQPLVGGERVSGALLRARGQLISFATLWK